MKNIFYFILFISFLTPVMVLAQQVEQGNFQEDSLSKDSSYAHHLDKQKRLSLAKLFVSKIKPALDRADNYLLSSAPIKQKNILPEGENLLLQPVLANNFRVDGVILSVVHNNKILLSLRDFADVLQIPIEIDLTKKIAKGWYIRENKKFFMDLAANVVSTDIGDFEIPDNIIVEDNDIFVPIDDLGNWLDFELRPVISVQELKIASSIMLPIQERYNRRQERSKSKKIPEPSLPRSDDDYYRDIGVPSIDVSTNSTYRKYNDSDRKAIDTHNVNIRTTGDFAKGTLTTQSQFNDVDRLKTVRVNYSRESLEGDLLGKLKARKFEVGDVTTANVPLGGGVSQELGLRITNTDSLRTFSTANTSISGNAIPGWDVELYRDSQFIAFKEIGDDGFYQFDNVVLFQSDNNFRLVFYGPQGEVREENVFIPVDQSLLSRGEGIYDVSVSLDGKITYNKNARRSKDEDTGSLNIAALYERPISGGITALAGVRSNQVEGVRNTVGNVGLSGTFKQTLLNAGVAVDDEGEVSGELIARRDFGKHKLSNSLSWIGANFDNSNGSAGDKSVLSNHFNANGPLPFKFPQKPRYNFSSNYSLDSDGAYSLTSVAGINGSISRIAFNETLTHITKSSSDEDELSALTNLTGTYGRNRLRLTADYGIKPNSELKNILANYSRDITKKLDIEIGATRRPLTNYTQYSAKLDWQAGFMRISPSIRYDSDKELFAGLNTRFGILKDPSSGNLKMYDSSVSNAGAISAFVYLDKNGDGKFNGDDEPLKDIVVKSPQNGGRKVTDENGLAIFIGIGKLRLTDVYIDPDSLQDPTWVSGFEGVSVLPRAGFVAKVDFPVHISGELDGSIYARAVNLPTSFGVQERQAKPVPLRNVRVNLYNDKGELENSVLTDATGFYYIPRIPPGRYLLIIDGDSALKGNFIRPEPQQIEITYDGSVIYGNDIYVDTGDGDIPSEFLSDLDDYKSRHPHIDFSNDNNDIVLNLGEFNSRLLMSVVWYKLRSRYNSILKGGNLFVPPAQSYADVKTGKHVLRVGLKGDDLGDAYARCRALMARDQYCKVEIFPSYIKHAVKDVSADKSG